MTSNSIKYKAGFKYQLAEDYRVNIGICPEQDIETPWVCLYKNGDLLLKAGFAWDGPSGPTFDRKTNMRGSAEHDGGYRLIRYGFLPLSYREKFDDRLKQVWIEDGMWSWVAALEIKMLKQFGEDAARPSGEPVVMTAP